MPLWEEAKELVSSAAYKFLPLRTMGWDVAISDRGAILLEGNCWWEQAANKRRAYSGIRALLKEYIDTEKKS